MRKIVLHLFVIDTGIWLHESGVLAASPDGIVRRSPDVAVHMSDCHDQTGVQTEPQLVEIKCPFSARELTVTSAAESCKDFFLGKLFSSSDYSTQ